MADENKVTEEVTRAARDTESREASARTQSWEPQSKLPSPTPPDRDWETYFNTTV